MGLKQTIYGLGSCAIVGALTIIVLVMATGGV